MEIPTKPQKLSGLAKSLHLPQNILRQYQSHSNTKPITQLINAKALLPYQSVQVTERRPVTTSFTNRKLIYEKAKNEREDSLSTRLKTLRGEHKALQSFSLSKLLSKVRVVSVDDEQELLGTVTQKQVKKNSTNQAPLKVKKKSIKTKMFEFTQKQKNTQTADHQLRRSLQNSRRSDEEESSNIFRRYFCPAFSFREPQFLQSIEPDKTYVINRWGQRIQSKRIHNFYSSHMYKRGYNRHFNTKNGLKNASLARSLNSSQTARPSNK